MILAIQGYPEKRKAQRRKAQMRDAINFHMKRMAREPRGANLTAHDLCLNPSCKVHGRPKC